MHRSCCHGHGLASRHGGRALHLHARHGYDGDRGGSAGIQLEHYGGSTGARDGQRIASPKTAMRRQLSTCKLACALYNPPPN